jgi:PPM family protein phosphatase
MSEILVSVFARTDVGMHRAGNEDSFLVADLSAGKVGLGPDVSKHLLGERGSLMIVSDGMGGAAAGEIASEMTVTSIRESLVEMTPSMEISERLRSAAEIANAQIWNRSQDNPELSGMGATLTAVLVQGTTAYIAQVGDSRAYLMRRGQIKQLTKDQSLAQMLVDTGAIKPEQMDSVPQNVIMQAMGTQPAVKVAMSAVELCKNDCLVICSDGLSNKVPPNDLREIIEEVEDLTEACRLLIDKANERGGEDNITVVIARFDGEALHSATESGSITGSFRALNQGYSSEYFSAARSLSSTPTEEEPETERKEKEQKQITSMLNVADLARYGSGEQVPAATDDTAQFEAPVISSAAIDEDEFRSRPTADTLIYEKTASDSATPQVAPVEHRYALILVIALISLLLLGATGFFIYSIYLKQKPPPVDVQQQPE